MTRALIPKGFQSLKLGLTEGLVGGAIKAAVSNALNWPDPTRLLNSTRLKKISEDIRKHKNYDYIVWDCPPILGLSDSTLISDATDGIILLVSIDKVDRSLPKEAIKKLKSKGAKIIGGCCEISQKHIEKLKSLVWFNNFLSNSIQNDC